MPFIYELGWCQGLPAIFSEETILIVELLLIIAASMPPIHKIKWYLMYALFVDGERSVTVGCILRQTFVP